ncbi:MAG TPA: hypothetical protein VK750_07365 [Cytophagaceae bacterium]|jgi:hypothetical protein|nr:hypothetical protein [Cytophagaceae bacterium]
MQLNKIKTYSPTKGSGNQVVDKPYDPVTWLGDSLHAPSRKAIRNQIESMGFVGNITVVDKAYGNDFTAKAGNVNKPFFTHTAAIQAMSSGAPGVCITMPGIYTVSSAFGFPMKDGIDHYLINATIQISPFGYSYGTIMLYPSYVKSKIYGKGIFLNMSSNQDWSIITPYVACDLEFEGIRFEGAKQLIGEDGSRTQAKTLKFKNCELVSTNNVIPPTRNAGNYNATGDTQAVFEDCYIKGNLMVCTSSANLFTDPYFLKFYRCRFEAISTNANNLNGSLTLLDYYASTNAFKVLLKDCSFKSDHENIHCLDGYGGIGTNKSLIIDNCRFQNGVEGWINNANVNMGFKLINNWSNNPSTGSVVNNLLSGTGITIDPNLEVEL